MTGVEQAAGEGASGNPHRRALLVFLTADSADAAGGLADVAADIRTAVSTELAGVSVEAFRSTGGYRPDPNRQQEFVPTAGAVQVDYSRDQETALVPLLQNLDIPVSLGDVVISAGHVVTCLEQSPSSYLLLLGAQRKAGLTPEQFAQHWSQVHAPHAVADLGAAPVPIGYELFLVDHEATAAMATARCPASPVDGWMHLTTRGPSDLAAIIRDPAHSAWVLDDEANFVDFAAPLVGQQMRSAPLSTLTPSTTK